MFELEYALFLGCHVPVRTINYEISMRKLAEVLGIKLVDLPFSCCGFPVEPINRVLALTMAARNLAIAERENLDITVLCNACCGMLAEAAIILKEDEELLKKINVNLGRINLEYSGGVKIRHFSRLLYEDYGVKRIKNGVKRPLKGLKIATHYGCHYTKPSEIYEDFDDPEAPKSIDKLVEATGAKSIDYPGKMDCCGGAVLGINEEIAMKMAKSKLDSVAKANADAMVMSCPFCGIMYDNLQRTIGERFRGAPYNIPVLYVPQLLGLALGLKPDELGFSFNCVSAEKLLKKVEEKKT